MSTVISLVLHGTYRDSVFLMKLSHELTRSTGAYQVSAMMATERHQLVAARAAQSAKVRTLTAMKCRALLHWRAEFHRNAI